MFPGWEVPPLPADLFIDPDALARAQQVGVRLGLGDVVHFGLAPEEGDPRGPGIVWARYLHIVFNDGSADFNPGSASTGAVYRYGGEGPWCVEAPSTTSARIARVIGTVGLSEVQELVRARWPGSPSDIARIYCPDGTMREPRQYNFAADLSLAPNPTLYVPQS